MRKLMLAAGFSAATFAALAPVEAQVNKKDARHGYAVIRVLLDGGAGANTQQATGAGATAPVQDPTRSVAAVVPYSSVENRLFDRNKSWNRATNPYWPAFRHKYGECYAYADKSFVQVYDVKTVHFEKDLKDAYERWSNKRSYDAIHDICNKALMYGMVDEAVKYCDEYLKMPEVADRAPQTEQYKQFAAVYKPLMERMKKPLPDDPEAANWKGKLGASEIKSGLAYTLLTFENASPAERDRRLAALDRNYKAYYIWHALQGIAPPIPAKKMIAVIPTTSSDMSKLREGLDGLPIVSDAFYTPNHNLLVLSPERMDANGNAFMNLVKSRYQTGYNRDELLRARMPAVKTVEEAIAATQMQMLAVADAYVTEEGDNAAISREGTRQLMAASGILTPNVQLPYWLEFGLGHFFQRPKGPLYLRKGTGFSMVVGLVTGYGTPNFEQHRAFDSVKPELARKPAQTLHNVLTGAYYAGAVGGFDPDPPPPQDPNNPTGGAGVGAGSSPQPDDEDNTAQGQAALRRFKAKVKRKADASAWALVYYLQKTRAPGLKKFYEELSRMPRDLSLEDEAVVKVFAKAFGLDTTAGEIDLEKFHTFADNWLKYMNNVPHFDYEIKLDGAQLDPFGAQGNATAPGTAPPPGGGGSPPPGGGGTPPGGTPPAGRPGG